MCFLLLELQILQRKMSQGVQEEEEPKEGSLDESLQERSRERTGCGKYNFCFIKSNPNPHVKLPSF